MTSHLFIATALAARCSSAASSPSTPHILMVVADDYGHNDIGYNQNTKTPFNPEGKLTTPEDQVLKTPTLDGLAKDGVILSNYYVQSCCSPTRAAILSGRYPSHTGIGPQVIYATKPYGLPVGDTTIADVLQTAGYRTAAIGKWHAGFCTPEMTPTYRGFDSYQGYFNGKEDYYTHYRNVSKTIRGYDFRNSSLDAAGKLPPSGLGYYGQYSTDIYNARTKEVVTQHQANYINGRTNPVPLFVYLAYQAVHEPLEVPASYYQQYEGHITNTKRLHYAGLVTSLDDGVASVVKAYKDVKMWDDTVLIFTTDNGGQVTWGGNNYPLRGWKFSTYEGGVRGVGFVRGTNNAQLQPLQQGKTSPALMHVTDWLPTIAALAGVTDLKTNHSIDGFNALPTLQGQAETTDRKFLVHNTPVKEDGLGGAFRMGDYKLMYVSRDGTNHAQKEMQVEQKKVQQMPPGLQDDSLHCTPPKPAYGVSGGSVDIPESQGVFLFNIADDPRECTNLAGDSNSAAKLTELAEAFFAYQSSPGLVRDGYLVYENSPKANPDLQPDGSWGPYGCKA